MNYGKYKFGNTLEEFLDEVPGLTKKKLAKKAGIHPTVLSRMITGSRLKGKKARERIIRLIKALHAEGTLRNKDDANKLLLTANHDPLSIEDPIEVAIIQLFETKPEEPLRIREESYVPYEVEPEVRFESDQNVKSSSRVSQIQQLRAKLKVHYVWAVICVFALVDVVAIAIWIRPSIMSWWEYRQFNGVQLSRLPPNGQVIYTTSFEMNVGDEWSKSQITETVNGERFLGEFGVADQVNLNLSSLGVHQSVVVAFDLYMIRSWDGNHEEEYIFEDRAYRVGPDFWGMKSDGQLLMKTTFSNNMGQNGIVYRQAFPDNYGRASYSPGYNARDVNSLGYTYVGLPMDSTYEIILKFEHDDPELNLTFFSDTVELREVAQGFESYNTIQNESWGIDNLQVILVED